MTTAPARVADRSGTESGRRFGVRLHDGGGEVPVHDLVAVALRRNPRRAHLLVSTVLGKHVPVDPRAVLGAGHRLGQLVAELLGEDRPADGAAAAQPVVLGFAETATGLGHAVAETLGAPCLHSTRRSVDGAAVFAAFREPHSHAVEHLLLPVDPDVISAGGTLVLVDDELSTATTARNAIAAVHARRPCSRYVLAALIDLRTAADRAELAAFAERLGATVDVVSLARGSIELPRDLAARAAAVADPGAIADPPAPAGVTAGAVHWHRGLWPVNVPESGRHGVPPAGAAAMQAAAGALADTIRGGLSGRVLVLGTEELMHVPTLIGARLADRGVDVRVSSTSRSPIVVVDEPDYPVRSVLTFPSTDRPADGPGPRYAYNVRPGEFDTVVLVVDSAAETAALRAGLVSRLRAVTPDVHVVVLPCRYPTPVAPPEPLRGPQFGSYPADEVQWLLTDLSGVPLEAPVEAREEAIQAGGAHYAESLPIEYQPDAEYERLFDAAVTASASRTAAAIGVVTQLVLAERGRDAVLVSLARAGTPIGILMRRWARAVHGLDLPHYAISIVRGKGIDSAALRWLAEHHDPRRVVFVDGWTGKGAIVRELTAAVELANRHSGYGFDARLAVLADPGHCVTTFGTRDDFLIPSACLNSTVSGLVSRTVLNTDVLAPGQFHGAKFYRDLADTDRSGSFLDAVGAQFAAVADEVAARASELRTADRTPSWRGWAEVERISREYRIGDPTLVKPGVGETTRVLLRRVPWRVLVRADAGADVAHVRLLAERRGVPVSEVAELGYQCVGLIHPRFTRAATGRDGRAVDEERR